MAVLRKTWCAALVVALFASAVASPAAMAKLSSGRTTVQNAMWAEDAFPTTAQLRPNSTLSFAYFNRYLRSI
jgi:hypothetical protein